MSVAKVYKQRKGLNDLFSRLEKLFPKSKSDQIKYDVHGNIYDLRWKTRIFTFLNLSGIIIYNLTPIFKQLFGLAVKKIPFERKKLPTNMWYWFDETQPGNRPSILQYFDSLQFKILSQKIREINPSDNEDALEDLKTQIKVHQELADISEKIEKIFSPSFLMNVLTTSFVICLTGFQDVVRFWIKF